MHCAVTHIEPFVASYYLFLTIGTCSTFNYDIQVRFGGR